MRKVIIAAILLGLMASCSNDNSEERCLEKYMEIDGRYKKLLRLAEGDYSSQTEIHRSFAREFEELAAKCK